LNTRTGFKAMTSKNKGWKGGMKSGPGRPKGSPTRKAKAMKPKSMKPAKRSVGKTNPFGAGTMVQPKGNPFGVKQKTQKRPKI
jgi:hypothetical protein